MHLFFLAKLRELNLTILEFFETAYVWRFNKVGNVSSDYCQYLLHGVIPPYCVAYLKELQKPQ